MTVLTVAPWQWACFGNKFAIPIIFKKYDKIAISSRVFKPDAKCIPLHHSLVFEKHGCVWLKSSWILLQGQSPSSWCGLWILCASKNSEPEQHSGDQICVRLIKCCHNYKTNTSAETGNVGPETYKSGRLHILSHRISTLQYSMLLYIFMVGEVVSFTQITNEQYKATEKYETINFFFQSSWKPQVSCFPKSQGFFCISSSATRMPSGAGYLCHRDILESFSLYLSYSFQFSFWFVC